MKKLLGAGLILLALGALVLSVFSGRTFTSQMEQLAQEAAEDPRVQLVSSESQAGWLTSRGQMTLAYTLDPRTELLVTTDWQARHRPGWVTFTGEALLATESEEGEHLDLLAELGLEPLFFRGRADWRQASYQLDLEALAVADDHYSIELSGGYLEGDYDYASGRQTGRFTATDLILGGGHFTQSALDFQSLELKWKQEGSYPWVAGDLDLTAESIQFTGPQGEVLLDQPRLSQVLALSEAGFNLQLDVTTGEVSSAGRALGRAGLRVSTENFDGPAMAQLMEFFGEEADWENLDEEAMQPGMEAMNQLLEGSPALVLEALEIKLLTPFEISQKAEGSVRFDGRNLPSSYLNRLSSGEISDDEFASRVRLELLFDRINPDLLLLVGIPPFLQDESADQQRLVWEAGELRLNGQRLPF